MLLTVVPGVCHWSRPHSSLSRCARPAPHELHQAQHETHFPLPRSPAVSLMRACKAERQLFCSDVQPGSARVFRCLAENMNDADFGNNCKYQIIYKLQRRQANWKLDPPLRKACREDVVKLCAEEEAKNSEEGLVYKCLIRNVAEISSGCQKVRGALSDSARRGLHCQALFCSRC